MDNYQDIEKSIITKSRKGIWRPFCKALKDYALLDPSDNVAVLINGSKQSFLMAECFKEILKHGDFKFGCSYVYVNDDSINDEVKNNARLLNIDLVCVDDVISYINENKINKLATSELYDDVLQSTMISLLYEGQVRTIIPKNHVGDLDLEIIRPMYLMEEADIDTWVKRHDLYFSEVKTADAEYMNKKKEMAKLIYELGKNNPFIQKNIFAAMNNVNLNCILGYHSGENNISFLDYYNDDKGE